MKYFLSIVVLLCFLSPFESNADIIIRGKAKVIDQSGGNTTIDCNGSKGTCMVIQTAVVGYVVDVNSARGKISFSCNSYTEKSVEVDGDRVNRVQLIDSKKL